MIYIQSNTDRNLAHHFDAACALYGAKDRGLDYRLTTYEEVESGKFNNLIKDHLFVGSVEFMRLVFSKIGKDIRLPRNSNRMSKIMTLREAHLISKMGKLFIKPLEIKLFTGLVLDGCKYSCLEGLPGETKVLTYGVVDGITSEWRAYINNDQIIDCRNYAGDFKISPDYQYIESVIKENKVDFPQTYTIDVGVLEDGQNIVVEFNDMWAIGNYGIDNMTYLKLLTERYFEIIRS